MMRGIQAALSPRTFLPLWVRYATSENQPQLPPNTPIAHAKPCSAPSCAGIDVVMITHVTIAAGFSMISARPTVKPDQTSLRCTVDSDAPGSDAGTAGCTGWLRAVRKP